MEGKQTTFGILWRNSTAAQHFFVFFFNLLLWNNCFEDRFRAKKRKNKNYKLALHAMWQLMQPSCSMTDQGTRVQYSMSTLRGSWLDRERGRWEVSVARQLVWRPCKRLQVRLSSWISRMSWSYHGDDPVKSGDRWKDFGTCFITAEICGGAMCWG